MVSFQSIKVALMQNTTATAISNYRIRPQPIVDSFKLPIIRIEPAKIPMRNLAMNVPKARAVSPVRSVGSDTSEEALPPPMRIMAITSVASVAKPITTIARASALVPIQPIAAEHKVYKCHFVDPICIGIEQQDVMYAIANKNVQQSIECEEARRLEARIGELYKEESGRSRGWVKTKLDAYFLPRAAVGARVQTKDAFAWENIWTSKEASALLDFVCLAKGIRVAVWKEERVIGLWPAADSSKRVIDNDKKIPIVHVGNVGVTRDIKISIQQGWKLVAPLSVEHGLEKLSIDELDGLAEKMGITIPSGKKTEKVRILASARMAMRL